MAFYEHDVCVPNRFLCVQWQANPAQILSQGQAIVEALSDATKLESGHRSPPDCKTAVDKCFSALRSSYDQKMGGFGRAPKFPQPGLLSQNTSLVRLLYIASWKLT